MPESLFLIKLQACCKFIEKETLTQAFSCEFCEISKNTFFTEHFLPSASDWFQLITYEFSEMITA